MMANSGKLHIAVIGVETGARKPLAVSSAFFDCSHPRPLSMFGHCCC